ncbi:hypothetical protein HD554DRAFT_2169743 [Boletus coccyginus]|nr:hypothetical protein HD554DRAFT_2169743 [Boletus coccyginus]
MYIEWTELKKLIRAKKVKPDERNFDTHTLPLTSTLPDMKSATSNYIRLQRRYKTCAEEELKSHPRAPVDDTLVDWGALDRDKTALTDTLVSSPRDTSTYLTLSALFTLKGNSADLAPPTVEHFRREVQSIVGDGVELPEELDRAIGE